MNLNFDAKSKNILNLNWPINRPYNPNTPSVELERKVRTLYQNSNAWKQCSISNKIEYLQEILNNIKQYKYIWVHAGLSIKDIKMEDPRSSEEWQNGPYAVARLIRLYLKTLKDIQKSEFPRLPSQPKLNEFGRLAIPVLPARLDDHLLYMNQSAEVILKPDINFDNYQNYIAKTYLSSDSTTFSGITLILGAGNASSIVPMDILYSLFVKGEVAIVKMSPVNACLGVIFEDIFEPLIKRGYLSIAHGGKEQGEELINNQLISRIHLTGSSHTCNAILKQVKDRHPPVTITRELGGVGSFIVAPEYNKPWSKKDLEKCAKSVVSTVVNNCGFNCIATSMLIVPQYWNQKAEFMMCVKNFFSQVPTRKAYFPGSEKTYQEFLSENQHRASQFSNPHTSKLEEGYLPWLLIEDLPKEEISNLAFNSESFGPILSQVALPGNSISEYLQNVTGFVNHILSGSLTTTIMIKEKELKKDMEANYEFNNMLHNLRIGSISINSWGAAYVAGSPTWGAHPEDPSSGIGTVHDGFMLGAAVEKNIYRAPFYPNTKPTWRYDHKTAHLLGPIIVDHEVYPSLLDKVKITYLGTIG